MNTTSSRLNQGHGRKYPDTITISGHTLLEMMFVSATLVIVVMALMSANLMGWNEYQLVQSKAGASDTSRLVLSQIPTDIRSAKMWAIGDMDGTTFTPVSNGVLQGTALQLCSTTNGTQYTIYYFDTNDVANKNGVLKKISSGSSNTIILASNLINTLYFSAENYNGVAQTNDAVGQSYKNVIHTTLQFCQFQYPLTKVGTNYLYDYYRLDFRVTPHLPE